MSPSTSRRWRDWTPRKQTGPSELPEPTERAANGSNVGIGSPPLREVAALTLDEGGPAGRSESAHAVAGRVLLALADRGISATLEGEQVRLRPSVAVTREVLAVVRAQAPALMALLRCVGTCCGPRVLTPRGPGLLRWRGYSGRLGVVLDGDPDAWHFFESEEVDELCHDRCTIA